MGKLGKSFFNSRNFKSKTLHLMAKNKNNEIVN